MSPSQTDTLTRKTRVEIAPGVDAASRRASIEREAALIELMSRRWAMRVVKALLDGPCRFGNLFESLPGISRTVLNQRLADLEQALLIRKRLLSPSKMQVYELTDWGVAGAPLFDALTRWAEIGPNRADTDASAAASGTPRV